MRNKLKSTLEKAKSKVKCCHFWVIESQGRHTSRAICKYCGAKREFFNWIEDVSWGRLISEFVDPDEMPNDELEGNEGWKQQRTLSRS